MADDHIETTEKFFFATCVRGDEVKGAPGFETEAMYQKKLCRGGKERNNFCILLPPEKGAPPKQQPEKKEIVEGMKKLNTTSNERKRARMKKLREAKQAEKQKKQKLQEEASQSGQRVEDDENGQLIEFSDVSDDE